MIYLDNGATSLHKPISVERAMIHAIKETKSEPWGPSWWSSAGERLAMQGTQAQSLIGDLGSHNHGTTRPVHHIY